MSGAHATEENPIQRALSMENKFVKALLLLAVAFLFIRPTLNTPRLGPFAETYLVVFIFVLPFAVTVKYGKKELYYLHSFMPCLIYVMLIFLFSDGSDFEGIKRVGRSCVDVVAAITLAWHAKRRFGDEAFRLILITIAIAAAIQAAAMYTMFVSPAFNSAMESVFGRPERRTAVFIARASGFRSRGSDGLAMNQAIGALGAFVLSQGKRGIVRIKYLLLVLFILTSTLLAARAGVAVFFGAISVYVVRTGIFGALPEKLKFAAILLFAVLLLHLLFPYLLPLALDVSRGYNNPVTRALEPIRVYHQEGRIATASSDGLLSGRHLVLPDSDVRFIFGSGQFGRQGSQYVKADIGYIRFLHGVGLIGVFLSVIPFVLVALYAFSTKNVHLIALVILGFMGHAKIVYLYSGSYVTAFSLFYLLASPHRNWHLSPQLTRETLYAPADGRLVAP